MTLRMHDKKKRQAHEPVSFSLKAFDKDGEVIAFDVKILDGGFGVVPHT